MPLQNNVYYHWTIIHFYNLCIWIVFSEKITHLSSGQQVIFSFSNCYTLIKTKQSYVDTQPNKNLNIHNAINNITSCHIKNIIV